MAAVADSSLDEIAQVWQGIMVVFVLLFWIRFVCRSERRLAFARDGGGGTEGANSAANNGSAARS